MNTFNVLETRCNRNRLAIPTTVGCVAPTSTSADRNSDSPIFGNSTDDFFHELHDDTNTVVAHDDTNMFENNVTDNTTRSLIVPCRIQFGIQLQHIISSHRGVDLKLFDEIMDLIKCFSNTDSEGIYINYYLIVQSTSSQTLSVQCTTIRPIDCFCSSFQRKVYNTFNIARSTPHEEGKFCYGIRRIQWKINATNYTSRRDTHWEIVAGCS